MGKLNHICGNLEKENHHVGIVIAMLRTERFSMVLNKYEKHLVEQLAEIEGGLSQAALIRSLIHKAAREHDLQPAPTPKKLGKARTGD